MMSSISFQSAIKFFAKLNNHYKFSKKKSHIQPLNNVKVYILDIFSINNEINFADKEQEASPPAPLQGERGVDSTTSGDFGKIGVGNCLPHPHPIPCN